MIKETADKLASYMSAQGVITCDMEQVLSYGFECMLATCLQGILLLVTALVLGVFPEMAALLLGFSALKKWIGGYHARSHLACVLQFTLMTVSGALLAAELPSPWKVPLLSALMTFTVSAVFWKAPQIHPSRPKSEEERKALKRKSRVMAVTLVMILVPLALFTNGWAKSLTLPAGMGAFLAAVTLFIPISNKRKEGC